MLNGVRYIDLFAGIGGFHQAMDAFGAECVFASEWDENCQQVYQKNYGIKPFGDITRINECDIPEHDIICAGFPCQAFSISGKQKGFNDTRGTLFFDVARIAQFHRPRLLFLENVKNLETHDSGKTLKVIIDTLKELGYSVFYQVLNASDFGVPQKRERIYILGFRNDMHISSFDFPLNHGNTCCLKDVLLPDSETEELVIFREDVVLSKNAFEKDLLGAYPQKPVRVGTVNKGGQGERIYSVFGHAVTLSAYGGGVGAKTGLYLTGDRIRRLAPRECARITGFPDSFALHENKNVSYRQFGNSVVVSVLKAVLHQVIATGIFPTPETETQRGAIHADYKSTCLV